MRVTRTISTLLTAALALTAGAQDYSNYRLADEKQLWRTTENAAGLAIDMKDSADNRGVAYFDYQYRGGDYHRVQQGGQTNQLRFFTERYQKIGNYLYGYGAFDFDMGRTKDRAWSDVMRTEPGNPYISGSSVSGKYDFQNFALTAKLASVRLGRFNYGASLRYKVGDLSRLRDPRSRVRLADYQIAPSATYTAGAHTVGLSAWYRRRKEKLTGLKTVQTDPSLKYYVMTGLEHATGTVGGYNAYWREYVDHELGGQLSYGYRSAAFSSVSSIGLQHHTEYAYGQYKYEPGRYHDYHYSLSSRNRITSGRLLHSIEAGASYEEAYADQFSSQLTTETDGPYTTQRWEQTMTFKKRYQLKRLNADAHYRLTVTDASGAAGYAGAAYALETVSSKHLLPTSELQTGSHLFSLEGGYGLAGRRLWVEARADYRLKGKADLTLNNPATDYAQGVLLPDMAYYEANWWQCRLELTWQQPITIKKRRTIWFASLRGSYLKTNNSLEGKSVGATVGLYY
jgi:hypothetical protein